MRKRVASLVSNILNPFAVSLAAVLVLSFESTSRAADALRWSLILVAVGLLPVFSATVYLARTGRVDGVLVATRRQRTSIYLLSIACAAIGYAVLNYMEAPVMLRAAFAGGLSGAILFTIINLWWKISLHTAFTAVLATILVVLYGWIATAGVVAVLLLAWARLVLKHHSPAQVVAGALLAGLITVAVFNLFGLP